MDFTNEKLGCSFSVPDRPTVRQQLAWYSVYVEAKGPERYERLFMAARQYIQKWDCPALPELDTIDLDKIDNPTQAQIMVWVSNRVLLFMNGLEDLPKNG